MKTKKQIEERLKGCIHTRNSQLGEKVCIRASIQAEVLKWVLDLEGTNL